MERTTILDFLQRFGDIDPRSIDGDTFQAFCREMVDREYGGPETVEAWAFFDAGFRAGLRNMLNGFIFPNKES